MKLLTMMVLSLFMVKHSTHEQFHDGFYKDLKRKDGISSCCSNKDCRRADDWRMVKNKYQVKLEGIWIEPPQSIIQHLNTPDGEAHACYNNKAAFMDPDKGPLLPPENWQWYCLIIPVIML